VHSGAFIFDQAKDFSRGLPPTTDLIASRAMRGFEPRRMREANKSGRIRKTGSPEVAKTRKRD
jgi:hypothetical protein